MIYTAVDKLMVVYVPRGHALKIKEVAVLAWQEGTGHKFPYESQPVKVEGTKEETVFYLPITWEQKAAAVDAMKKEEEKIAQLFEAEYKRKPANLRELKEFAARISKAEEA